MTYEADGLSSLEAVNLEFSGYRKIGIIGESGAGKSTLVDILGGFLHPTSGTLTINGSLVSALTDEGWRKQTAYIPQRPYIFSGTLADNVRFYYPEASQEAVAAALESAGLSKLVSSLPEGLKRDDRRRRPLAQRRGRSSVWHWPCALLSSRSIMLLDEPTAHLDIETEYELKETMLPLFEDKLVFLKLHTAYTG